MGIPRYKAQPFQANFRNEEMGDLASIAEAKGQGKLAQEQAQTGSFHAQAANQEVRNLSQTLNDWVNVQNSILNTAVGTGVGVIQQQAKQKGVEDAQAYVVNLNNQMRNIQNSDMPVLEKVAKMNALRAKLNEHQGGLYGEAYDGIVKADFHNSAVLRAAGLRHDVKQISGEDPEKFKSLWAEVQRSNMEYAPDDASLIVQNEIYDSVGQGEYRNLYKAKEKKDKIRRATTAKGAYGELSNIYLNSLQAGDVKTADQAKIQMHMNIQKRVEDDSLTPEEGAKAVRDIENKGFVATTLYNFDTGIKRGDGIAAYNGFMKKMGTLDFRKYSPAAIKQVRSHMESALKAEFKSATERMNKSYDEGVQPDQADVEKFKKYSQWGEPAVIKKLTTKMSAYNVTEGVKNLKLSEQFKEIEPVKNGDSPEVIAVKKEVQKQVNSLQTRASKDVVQTAYDQGDHDQTVHVSPESETLIDDLKVRTVQYAINGKKYDTVNNMFFGTNEVQEINDYLSGDASPSDKVDFITKLNQLPQAVRETAFKQIDKKNPGLGQSLALIRDGRPEVAQKVLDGYTLMKQPYIATQKKDIKEGILLKIAGPMMSDPKHADRLMQSIMSLYAFNITQIASAEMDKDELKKFKEGDLAFNQDALDLAITEIVGQEVSGWYSPPGVDSEDAEDWFDSLEDKTLPDTKTSTGQGTNRLIEDSTPVRTTGNTYMFLVHNRPLLTPEGQIYTLDYEKQGK